MSRTSRDSPLPHHNRTVSLRPDFVCPRLPVPLLVCCLLSTVFQRIRILISTQYPSLVTNLRTQTMSRKYSRSALTIVAGVCFTALVYLSSPYSPPPPPAFFRSGPGPHRPWGLGFGFGEGGSRGPSLLKRWLWEEDERYQESVRERQELIEKWGPGEGQVDPCVHCPCAFSCLKLTFDPYLLVVVDSPRMASSTPCGITLSRHSSALIGSSVSVCVGMEVSGSVVWIVSLSSRNV